MLNLLIEYCLFLSTFTSYSTMMLKLHLQTLLAVVSLTHAVELRGTSSANEIPLRRCINSRPRGGPDIGCDDRFPICVGRDNERLPPEAPGHHCAMCFNTSNENSGGAVDLGCSVDRPRCVEADGREAGMKKAGMRCAPAEQGSCCDPRLEPGSNGNPFCLEGHACCPNGSWSCSIGDGRTFPCGNELLVNPEGKACDSPPRCCEPRLEPGTNGNPACFGGHGCCPEGTWTCATGVGNGFRCGDAVYVDPPSGDVCGQPGCLDDVAMCRGGSFVRRDPENNCEFFPCPCDLVCTRDVKTCPDGSMVLRDPCNNCEFSECPCNAICMGDTLPCPDGSSVSRDPCNECRFPPCPRPLAP